VFHKNRLRVVYRQAKSKEARWAARGFSWLIRSRRSWPGHPLIRSMIPEVMVSAQFQSVFATPMVVIRPVRSNQFDASPLQSPTQWFRVVSPVRGHPFGPLPRATFGPADAGLLERGFLIRGISPTGTFKPNFRRTTLTIDQYHDFASLRHLVLYGCDAQFLASRGLRCSKFSSSAAILLSPVHRAEHAKCQSRHLAFRTVSRAADMSLEMDTCRTKIAERPRPQCQETAFKARSVRCPGTAAIS